eukprot:TRINITY_DN57740_c0_g1_i2.p1 TRINITY_DN57740_c0_g1~~TRINITY_DN57740_c0_g1_i2.p1  ORF type:complete len:689 (+),score=170.67 TRINITY_DN57740_c0_g1_i2:129-2069(+)
MELVGEEDVADAPPTTTKTKTPSGSLQSDSFEFRVPTSSLRRAVDYIRGGRQRKDAIREIFDYLDAADCGCLALPEVAVFLRGVYLKVPGRKELPDLYLDMCKKYCCDPGDGMSKRAVLRLVDDEHLDGLVAGDDVLTAFASTLRRDVVRSIFYFLGPPGEGAITLGEAHLGSLAETLELEADWPVEYRQICGIFDRDPAAGLDEAAFNDLVEPNSPVFAFRMFSGDLRRLNGALRAQQRDELVGEVFDTLDVGDHGSLKAEEMLPFAWLAGYTGSSKRWVKEFNILCKDFDCDPAIGLSKTAFRNLVNNRGEDGSYCTTGELYEFWKRRSQELHEECGPALFEALDVWQDGTLGEAELRPLGDFLGFTGTSSASWSSEYIRMCQDHKVVPRVGFDRAAFLALLNDKSDTGCSVTDKELRVLLRDRLAVRRDKLVAALFEALDGDEDDLLQSAEVQTFAKLAGWQGEARDWPAEYRKLCVDFGGNPDEGLRQDGFLAMVADKSDRGCFLTDDELLKMLAAQTQRNRAARIAAAFSRLDVDDRRALSLEDMQAVMDTAGIIQDDEYVSVCEAGGCDPAVGLTLEAFADLVNGQLLQDYSLSNEQLGHLLHDIGGTLSDAVDALPSAASRGGSALSVASGARFELSGA